MRQWIAAFFALACLTGLPSHAADVDTIQDLVGPNAVKGPLYTCHLSGSMSGGSIAIIVGGQYIHGMGNIICTNNFSHKRMRLPVKLKLIGAGVGFELSQIKNLRLFTAGLGVNNPNFFNQSFAIGATTGASLVRAGFEFDTAVRLSKNGVGFELGIQGREVLGLGAHLYAMTFQISPR